MNREVLITPDGGQLAIDWENRQSATKKHIVLILPGIDGKTNDKTIKQLVHEARALGCIAVVMSYRGVEVDLLTPYFYTAQNFDDLEFVVKLIKLRYPTHSLFAVGVSYGAYLNLKRTS